MITHTQSSCQHHLKKLSRIRLLFIALPVALGLATLGEGCKTVPPVPQQVGTINSQGFLKQWQANLGLGGGDQVSEIHLTGNDVIVYTRRNQSYWLTADGGALLAVNQLANRGHTVHPPVTIGDRIVVPTTNSLQIFSKNGHRENVLESPRVIESPAAGSEDALLVGVSVPGRGGRMAKISVGPRAQIQWELYTRNGVSAAPVIQGDTVFIGGLDGLVNAVTTVGRQSVWSLLPDSTFHTDGPITGDLVADDNGVYVASQDQKLYCINRTTGKIKWVYYAGVPLVDGPMLVGNLLLQPIPNDGLVALQKGDGDATRQPLWKQPLAQQVVAVDDKFIYARSGGSILALEKATGAIAFQTVRTDFAAFATNTTKPLIFAATRNGSVLGVRPVIKPGTAGEIVLQPVSKGFMQIAMR